MMFKAIRFTAIIHFHLIQLPALRRSYLSITLKAFLHLFILRTLLVHLVFVSTGHVVGGEITFLATIETFLGGSGDCKKGDYQS